MLNKDIEENLDRLGIEFSLRRLGTIEDRLSQLNDRQAEIFSLLSANRTLKIYEACSKIDPCEFSLSMREPLDQSWLRCFDQDDISNAGNSFVQKTVEAEVDHPVAATCAFAIDSCTSKENNSTLIWNRAIEFAERVAFHDEDFGKSFPDGTSQEVMDFAHPAIHQCIEWHERLISLVVSNLEKVTRHHPFWIRPFCDLSRSSG